MAAPPPAAPAREARLRSWERRTDPVLLGVGLLFLVSWALPIVLPRLPGDAVAWLESLQQVAWALFAADYAIRLWLAERRFVVTHLPSLLVVLLPLLHPLAVLRSLLLLTALMRRVTLPLRMRVTVYVSGSSVRGPPGNRRRLAPVPLHHAMMIGSHAGGQCWNDGGR
ncbi:hypothetical protein [Nonomuraea aridisoli]|uniref:hypothetical protein n=1 Tax=Nonomuraea aridisoli TaxID=2070368 RepID=UPI0015E8C42F|nr:hypothetical protein [Nonomuraea aridisoli]